MSNNLLESLWSRVDANIGARIKQVSELLTQALSANTESKAARDAAVVAEGKAAMSASVSSTFCLFFIVISYTNRGASVSIMRMFTQLTFHSM